ncbi:MAG: transglutaminase-like domain-containing protein [Desulfuromonadaceae bacterium]|nr:transglutaminase-like domain-containing protein [Desulfuromonadaceae bacterium]
MRKIFIAAAALCCLIAGSAWGAGQRVGVVTLEVDLSAQGHGKEAKLWVPYPTSDKNQTVDGIKVTGDFASSGVYTDLAYNTPMLYAEWPKEAVSRKLVFTFNVVRKEIAQRNLPSNEPQWNRADYSEYLQPTSRGPLDGEVKILAERITKGNLTNLAKARAIYEWTVGNMYRDPDTKGCGQGDVCELLKKPGGKCTDISSVFIALCRASGIPAREVFSIRLGKKAEEDISTYQHCWAEFFIPGYGWVTADPADVRKAMLVEKLELGDQKTKEYSSYFWGGIDAYRVVLARGRDLILNPVQAGAPLNTFGYPYAEVGGKPVDFYDPKTFTYRYTFKEK